jgi:Na+-transporting NADH:ubiquinone oxidoreductase subunit F
MGGISLILIIVVMFTIIFLALVLMILLAQSKLIPSGNVRVMINNDPELCVTVPIGGKLINSLADKEIYLPSACGGGATCGQCKIQAFEGGGTILPTETSIITRREARDGYRLSCQVTVRGDMSIAVPAEVLSVKKWVCTVRSNRNVSTFIKEVVLELPEGEYIDFQAGRYILMEAPPHTVYYKDFIIEDEFSPTWDHLNIWRYVSVVDEPIVRAYSMANYPDEKDIIMLNVRIATPPPSNPDAPPGKMSSYIFSLKPGARVTVSGPYGEFLIRKTDNEMIFIAGGAGMAPLRSHIFDQLRRIRTRRKISFWYGARNLREAFYIDVFNTLAREHDNFEWHFALSEPLPGDNWNGYTGFIHRYLYESYLNDHPAPEDCEYYLCGPPMMIAGTVKMLDELGVEPENIFYEDFGG